MGNQQRQASAPNLAVKQLAREVPIVARDQPTKIHQSTTPPKPTPAPFRSTANYQPQDFEQVCRAAVAELVQVARELQSRAASSLTSAASSAAASAAAPAETGAGSSGTELIDLLTTQDMLLLNKIEIQMQRARRVENSLSRYKGVGGGVSGIGSGKDEGECLGQRLVIIQVQSDADSRIRNSM